jgi:LysM repeat protein
VVSRAARDAGKTGWSICAAAENIRYAAAMKTCRTYPTKHPHWIDDDTEETRRGKAARRFRERTGISFPIAFAIVLGLHLAAIGGFYALGSSKKSQAAALAAKAAAEKPAGPKSDALKRNDWPQTNASPRVVAKPPVKAPEKPAKPKATQAMAQVKSPTPPAAKTAATPQAPVKTVATPPRTDSEDLKKLFLSNRATPAAVEKPAQPLVAADSEVRAAIPVVAPKPTTTRTPAVSEYTLQAGDNLYMVSRKLEVSYNDLMQANGLNDPRQLRVGQKLKVPTRRESSM